MEYAVEVSPCEPDGDGDGVAFCDGDCDDDNPDMYPGNTEICDGIDNDCDGLVDENVPPLGTCSVGTGDCYATGPEICSPDGGSTECSAVPGLPLPEICDGRDNDCDGLIDEGFPSDGVWLTVQAPTAPHNLTKTWVGGYPLYDLYYSLSKWDITDPGNWQGSTATQIWIDTNPDPILGGAGFYRVTSPCVLNCPEVCDDADNDCNGIVDDPGSEESCHLSNADPICDTGICLILGCLHGFEDCDLDPTNGCETDLNHDPDNCGDCGMVCTFPNAEPICVGRLCLLGPCLPWFADCDSDPVTGCETDIGSDVNNCGSCGLVCPGPGATCVAGTCQAGS